MRRVCVCARVCVCVYVCLSVCISGWPCRSGSTRLMHMCTVCSTRPMHMCTMCYTPTHAHAHRMLHKTNAHVHHVLHPHPCTCAPCAPQDQCTCATCATPPPMHNTSAANRAPADCSRLAIQASKLRDARMCAPPGTLLKGACMAMLSPSGEASMMCGSLRMVGRAARPSALCACVLEGPLCVIVFVCGVRGGDGFLW